MEGTTNHLMEWGRRMDERTDDVGPRGNGSTTGREEELPQLLAKIVCTMREMEQGLRPVAALDTIASPLAARRIRKVVHSARRAGARQARARRTGARRARTEPPIVLSTTYSHPSAGVAEGVVLMRCDERTRPYCVRLEQEGDRWRLVELAPPDAGLRAAVTEASRTGAVPLDENGVRRSSGRDGVGFSAPAMPGEQVARVGEERQERTEEEGGDQKGSATAP